MTLSRYGPCQPLRFGTRGSALALAQTDLAISRLRRVFPDQPVEVHVIRTEGDLDRVSPLTEIGGRGVFTNAIEQEILRGGIDAAVHSAKDLPTIVHPELPIVAFPDRDDPRDVLVSRHKTTLDRLPARPVIGTSSRRRAAQIMRLRPDARIQHIRGNIDTRLRKAEEPEFDGVVLAAAGVLRMGWGDRISEFYAIERFVPSPGQGAIAIQARGETPSAALLAAINDPIVSEPVRIERAFLAALGAGCTTPVGAFAERAGDRIRFVGMVADEDGERIASADELLMPGNETRQVAEIAARLLAEVGGGVAKRQWAGKALKGELSGASVVVTRPRPRAGQLIDALACRGAEAIALPVIRVEPVADLSVLDSALQAAAEGAYEWIALTSVHSVDIIASRLAILEIDGARLATVKVAAVGQATAAAARAIGLNVALVPATATGESLAAALRSRLEAGMTVLFPRSAIGRDVLLEAMQNAGVTVDAISAYQTLPERDVDPEVLDRVRRGEVDAMTFSSPSSVYTMVSLLGDRQAAWTTIPAICAGPVTASAASEAGLRIGAISSDPSCVAMTEAMVEHWRNRDVIQRPRRTGQRSIRTATTEGRAG